MIECTLIFSPQKIREKHVQGMLHKKDFSKHLLFKCILKLYRTQKSKQTGITCRIKGSPGVALWQWMTEAKVLVRL